MPSEIDRLCEPDEPEWIDVVADLVVQSSRFELLAKRYLHELMQERARSIKAEAAIRKYMGLDEEER